MKRYILTLIAIAITTLIMAQDGIQFSHDSWNSILEKAQNENKNIFIDCYTTWCGPCKKMSAEVFPLNEVGDYFNPKFVSVKVDMEKGEGIELRKKFDVNVFPTLIFCNSKGEELHRFTGYVSGEQLVLEAKKANEGGYANYRNKYDAGNRQPEFVKEFMKYLYSGRKINELSPIAEEYLISIGSEKWMDEESWMMINSYLKRESGTSPVIRYVHKNRDAYKKLYGEKEVDKKLRYAFYTTTFTFSTTAEFKQYISELSELNVENIDNMKFLGGLHYALLSKEWDKFLNPVRQRIESMGEKLDTRLLYYFADQIERRCTVASVRTEASEWCKLGLEASENDGMKNRFQKTYELLTAD